MDDGARTDLSAGPLTARLVGVDLRDVRVGGVEVVRRLYVAVRDPDWGTVPGEVDDLRVDSGQDAFRVTFACRHRAGHGLDFAWRGEITGAADGTIAYAMDGEARGGFAYNRIGICVLHPGQASAGRAYAGHGPSGPVGGALPDLIAAQRKVDGALRGIFEPVEALAVEYRPGYRVRFAFDGDLFETEDQRNWTDGSFKTYSTPLRLGTPRQAAAGDRIAQRVTLTADAPGPDRPAGETAIPATVRLGGGGAGRLPLLGVSVGAAIPPAAFAALRPAFLRLELSAGDEVPEAARASQLPLELAVRAQPEGADAALAGVARRLGPVRPARVLVFAADARSGEPSETTPPGLLAAARRAFPGVPVGGGSDLDFAELNRSPPPADALDVLAYAICPQVHATDERSIVETLEAQPVTVRTARALAPAADIAVGPVVLSRAGEDPRAGMPFFAAWLVGSIAALATAGAASIAFDADELLNGGADDPAPTPAGRLFATLAQRAGEPLRPVEADPPLSVAALAVGDLLLVANLVPEEREIRLEQPGAESRLLRLAPYGTATITAGAGRAPAA